MSGFKFVAKGIVILLVTLGFASVTVHASTYKKFSGVYDGLLKTYVHKARKNGVSYMGVDYRRWKNDKRHAQALSFLIQSRPATLKSLNEKKSFWINAYNFLTIDLIVRKNEQKSIKNLGSLFESPWKKYKWKIGSRNYTLDQIEHKILRPLGDARIHFAINCASVSCPDIRRETYKAKTLNAQLTDQVRRTLQNRGKGLAQGKREIRVSKVFDWFSIDFNKGDIKGWLKPYVAIDKNTRISFLKYDWSLNSTR
ncbi:MAG TPA: DUF547 domain-containing protein [Rhizobiales bacterium]|nr:DUF547 domain-containing protein [Hyphomicrobiales bacterium]